MKAINKSLHMFAIQIRKDGMLILILVAPILAGVFFKFGIPLIESLLTNHFDQEAIISPYYGMIDLFLGAITSYLLSFIASMTMLDEYDSNLISHYVVTPLKKSGYLHSRLSIPLIISWGISILVLMIFSLQKHSIMMIVILCGLLVLTSLAYAFITFSFSKNKVEGLAIAKLSGITMMGIIIPYILKSSSQYFFSFLPSFWIAKFSTEPSIIWFILALATSIFWIWILYKKFNKKLST
ncbi:MAG: hypothetical protein PHC62_10765 [Candidatus Izemoplasmatales bacterium]|jgi:fluoroquinolone transport system permease protein|nr:hypothetical protein [Candidatus Izemoplasmatales bacterium]